jgi:hypothetical protein
VSTLSETVYRKLPGFSKRLRWFLENRQDLAQYVTFMESPKHPDDTMRLLAIPSRERLVRVLRYVLDEDEFLTPHGVRSLSRVHRGKPYVFPVGGQSYTVDYEPGESQTGLFGGNSNWRGPIWFPVNYLIIESLQKFHHYYGDDFKIECPTGSGRYLTINEVATELGRRLTRLFTRNEQGRRPVFGQNERLQSDPHFNNYINFHEYFHGEIGRGVGASHQTGWTGLIAKIIQPRVGF